jgi:hypothetical protein
VAKRSATKRATKIVPDTCEITIIAQDPSIKDGRNILTAKVKIPAEELLPGPCGYRVNVIDYDAAADVLYTPAVLRALANGKLDDPFDSEKRNAGYDKRLIDDPRFHAQNVYAIVMRTLAQFEFALGRRVPWGSDGHQLHIAPHAFAEANAFYSKDDRGIFFGYFTGTSGKTVFTCLSHDVVAHETTHAILDGLRGRYMEPSSPDQAAFHEGFADVIALLSIFGLPDVVSALLAPGAGAHAKLIGNKHLSRQALRESVLLGMAEQMGAELSGARGEALRQSVKLEPNQPYRSMPEYEEPHDRGELLVAGMMNAFIDIWLARLKKRGFVAKGKKDRSSVVEDGAQVANHLLTMTIRAIDYCPPTDINFPDFLSALLTVDREVVPDDSKYGYRDALIANFAKYDIKPAITGDADGAWQSFDKTVRRGRVHFDSMAHDKEEMFRFVWENREALEIDGKGYIEVESVRPAYRIGPDGFILRETVAEYVQIMTLRADELKPVLKVTPPKDMPKDLRVRIFGGGALIFDEYGQLKYQIRNRLESRERQEARLQYLWESGYFEEPPDPRSHFALLHLARATR